MTSPLDLDRVARKQWVGISTAWLILAILFCFLYAVARRSIVNEIRYHARGVAIAAAAAIDYRDLEQVRGQEDTHKEAYGRVQSFLSNVSTINHDVRYIYTMRRSAPPNARESDYEFIVDQAARDANGNGLIDRDEVADPPGKRYDASALPEMIQAWDHPAADWDVSPDPPYPDLMTGYAPIRDENGETRAIVGVDVTASTIRRKLTLVRLILLAVGLVLGVLVTSVLRLTYRQRLLLVERGRLIADLQEALARVKRLHGLLPICSSCKKVRNDTGYWEQIEKYVSDHSEAAFTHSMCPDCAERLFDELHEQRPGPLR